MIHSESFVINLDILSLCFIIFIMKKSFTLMKWIILKNVGIQNTITFNCFIQKYLINKVKAMSNRFPDTICLVNNGIKNLKIQIS